MLLNCITWFFTSLLLLKDALPVEEKLFDEFKQSES